MAAVTHDGPVPDDGQAKAALRARLRAARQARPAAELVAAGAQLARVVMAMPEVREIVAETGGCVAAYVSMGGEPPTGPLLDALQQAGLTVLLPVLLPDGDLDWSAYDSEAALVPSAAAGRFGLREPPGVRLGVTAVVRARLVLVPALAASLRGDRLGQGGGSYDRALVRVPVASTVAVVFDDEVLEAIPTQAHDRRVAMAVTPARAVRF